jgi:hypothetical protein
MVKIKASPQYPLKVVPHRPLRQFIIGIILFGIVCALLITVFHFGKASERSKSVSSDFAKKILAESRSSNELIAELKKQLAALQLAAQVDRQTSEDLRAQLLSRREQIGELEREISLLRMMSNKFSNNSQGLGFGTFSVKPLAQEGDYEFRLMVHKLAESGEAFNGNLTADLVGRQGDKQIRIPLTSLIIEDTKGLYQAKFIPLDFKYFQVIEANIRLPDQFEPEYLAVKLVSNSRKPLVVEQQLEWLKDTTL